MLKLKQLIKLQTKAGEKVNNDRTIQFSQSQRKKGECANANDKIAKANKKILKKNDMLCLVADDLKEWKKLLKDQNGTLRSMQEQIEFYEQNSPLQKRSLESEDEHEAKRVHISSTLEEFNNLSCLQEVSLEKPLAKCLHR